MNIGLQSFGCCPWCRSRIQMQKQSDGFVCPVCACIFRHRWLPWCIAIPTSIIFAFLLFQLIPIGMVAAFAAVIMAWLLINRMRIYVIIKKGREDIITEETEEYIPDEKESKWFIAFLAILIFVIIGFFVWAMKSI